MDRADHKPVEAIKEGEEKQKGDIKGTSDIGLMHNESQQMLEMFSSESN